MAMHGIMVYACLWCMHSRAGSRTLVSCAHDAHDDAMRRVTSLLYDSRTDALMLPSASNTTARGKLAG